jgi:N-acetylglucosamine-6-phosphate deacetylase
MPESTIYTADRIFTGETWLTDHAIIIQDGIIKEVSPVSSLSMPGPITHFDKCFIAPCFIDLQIYGAYGKLLAVYPEAESLRKLNEYCVKGGAAFCLPTLATNTKDVFYKSIDAVREYWKNNGRGVLGLHLEGPWINPVKRGAHIELLIHPPAIDEVRDLLEYGKGVIRMITLAPEVCDRKIINLILSYGVVISAGHSNATYEEANEGFALGIAAVTHLYNAMSPLQHRQPGLVGATMDHNTVVSSIIPDGYHVDFPAIRIAKRIMQERLFAITDAVTETTEGHYGHTLAGNKYEASGILSGSALTMAKAFQNLVRHAAIETGEAIRMCSLYPARIMKMDHVSGRIAKDYASHLVVIDQDLELVTLLAQ